MTVLYNERRLFKRHDQGVLGIFAVFCGQGGKTCEMNSHQIFVILNITIFFLVLIFGLLPIPDPSTTFKDSRFSAFVGSCREYCLILGMSK